MNAHLWVLVSALVSVMAVMCGIGLLAAHAVNAENARAARDTQGDDEGGTTTITDGPHPASSIPASADRTVRTVAALRRILEDEEAAHAAARGTEREAAAAAACASTRRAIEVIETEDRR